MNNSNIIHRAFTSNILCYKSTIIYNILDPIMTSWTLILFFDDHEHFWFYPFDKMKSSFELHASSVRTATRFDEINHQNHVVFFQKNIDGDFPEAPRDGISRWNVRFFHSFYGLIMDCDSRDDLHNTINTKNSLLVSKIKR